MSEIAQIKWKRGFHAKGSAKTTFNALEKLRAKSDGKLTAGGIVAEAQNKSSVLHKHFEWNDSVAAESYRMGQARYLMRSIEVVYKKAPTLEPQRVYVTKTEPADSAGNPERKVYSTIDEILRDPVARDELLGNAIRDAISYRRKYAQLSELSQVFTAIDDFVQTAKI